MPLTSTTSTAKVTKSGQEFINNLRQIAKDHAWGMQPCVFTSTLPRAIHTGKAFITGRGHSQQWSALNLLDTGVCHGMKVEDIKKTLPEEYGKWRKDAFRYRFPGGESYMDLCHRLSPLVLEIERTRRPVVVISHLSTLQALYAYFKAVPVHLAPTLKVKRHSLIILHPHIYGWKETNIDIDNYIQRRQTKTNATTL